jgi:competence protein ComEA
MLLLAMGYVGRLHLDARPELVLNPVADSPPVGAPAEVKPEQPSEVVVHVVGAVNKPGLVRLSNSDRVQDAIDKAGGATKDAQLELINLAANLVDGTQLDVPRREIVVAEATAKPAKPVVRRKQPVRELPYRISMNEPSPYVVKPIRVETPVGSASKPREPKQAPSTAMVSLNSASKAELDSLPGIGPATAAKIIQYREEHGGFSSIEELLDVKGIGPKKLAAMRDRLKL